MGCQHSSILLLVSVMLTMKYFCITHAKSKAREVNLTCSKTQLVAEP